MFEYYFPLFIKNKLQISFFLVQTVHDHIRKKLIVQCFMLPHASEFLTSNRQHVINIDILYETLYFYIFRLILGFFYRLI